MVDRNKTNNHTNTKRSVHQVMSAVENALQLRINTVNQCYDTTLYYVPGDCDCDCGNTLVLTKNIMLRLFLPLKW